MCIRDRDLEEGELAQKKAEPDAEEVKEEVTEALDEEGSVLKEFDYAEKKKEKEEESIFGNKQYDEPEYVDDYDDDDKMCIRDRSAGSCICI